MEREDSVEITAPSVDEAIIIGLTRLTATRDEVDIDVLEEASKGFLGIGAREARVRLTRRASEPAPVAVEAPPSPPALPDPAPAREPEPLAISPPPPAPKPAPAPPPPEPAPVAPPSKPAPPPAPAEDTSALDRGQVERVAREVAEQLFSTLGLDVLMSWHQEDRPTLWVEFQGKDANSLVGPRARTLNSVQYLFRTLVHHQVEGNYNLVVDADGYRKRRRRNLESLARKKADQAVSAGQTLRLRSMPASERRVIHMILRQDDRVDTESVGSGRNRSITIVPRKK